MASDRRRARRMPPGRERGFVLAITLWLLAGIAVAVALMTLWSLQQVTEARIAHERLQDELAVSGTRDTLLYIASTRELTRAGLPVQVLADDKKALRHLDDLGSLIRDPIGGELQLDGSPYRGLQSTVFAIQDEAGLFPMVLPGPAELDRFLLAQGVSPEQVPRLRDTLLDYIDSDDLTRINGAERRDYEREHLPPPPNRRLLTPAEISRPAGWASLPAALLAQLPGRISPYYSGAVNLNTMPRELLPTWVPGCPEACDRLVEARKARAFVSALDVEARLGILLPGDNAVDYRFLADRTMRMTLWGESGAAWRIHVRLTPLVDKRGPWTILASYPIARPSFDEPADDTGSPLLADPAPDRR